MAAPPCSTFSVSRFFHSGDSRTKAPSGADSSSNHGHPQRAGCPQARTGGRKRDCPAHVHLTSRRSWC
eukprot:5322514-Prymnesium_polylepis.1